MSEATDRLLARYREIQDSEGVTIEAEKSIARAQGEAWRAYLSACREDGVSPVSPDRVDWPW